MTLIAFGAGCLFASFGWVIVIGISVGKRCELCETYRAIIRQQQHTSLIRLVAATQSGEHACTRN